MESLRWCGDKARNKHIHSVTEINRNLIVGQTAGIKSTEKNNISSAFDMSMVERTREHTHTTHNYINCTFHINFGVQTA